MNNIFTISDHHFGHYNILQYEKEHRPFDSLDEMHEFYICQWNSVVGSNDLVVYCGDFGMGGVEYLSSILFQLNGIKFLVRGNHDYSHQKMKYIGFNWSGPHLCMEGLLFTHKPRPLHQLKGFFNIHGHIHSKTIPEFNTPFHLNISVEKLNGIPLNLKEATHESTETAHLQKWLMDRRG